MRKYFVAGNWKMNLTMGESAKLAADLKAAIGGQSEVDVAVCPPFVYVPGVVEALKGSTIAVGAQNLYPAPGGAFTGEVSPKMIKDVGCRYVIIGHSERRHILGEKDEFINAKVKSALEAQLLPILCVGELLAERQSGRTQSVVSIQVEKGLAGLTEQDAAKITIAYEPVWAIGTGETATPAQAQEVHAYIRGLVKKLFGDSIADAMRIQYGGSVKPDNAAELMAQPDVDGSLVGGAALKAENFVPIVRAAKG
ncbi:MAG TPA: triose-phosphate isomerase [Candidatus Brocadiia bacterium]|nr:triose-phosphate isomerase [Candidatus Brocadiia bacterium]